MEFLGFELRDEALLETLTFDVLKSAEIEGELLNPEQVRSSIAQRLGMEFAGSIMSDRIVDGMVEMMIDATHNCFKPLTKDRLFNWHAALFLMGRSGIFKIIVADWRKDTYGQMQVVSGAAGREKVHFQAPNANLVEMEMNRFLKWFLSCLINSLKATDKILTRVLLKEDFWNKHSKTIINERQKKVLNKLLDGFEGKLTSMKWAKITKCSKDTAIRDINDLINKDVLLKESAGGRSTNYELKK